MLATPLTPELHPVIHTFKMPTSNEATMSRTQGQNPQKVTGLRGLFSRKSVTSSEPVPSSRFSRTPAGFQHAPTASALRTKARRKTKKEAEHDIRFISPDLPLTRRSDQDGKWQPPSLSKGSISTPTLALLQVGDETTRRTVDDVEQTQRRKGGHTHSLSLLFQAAKSGLRGQGQGQDSNATPKAGPASLVSPKPSKVSQTTPTLASKRSREPVAPSIGLSRPFIASKSVTVPVISPSMTPDPPPPRHQLDDCASLKSPSHGVPQAPPDSTLSKEHYHLRLATSYIVKTLLPLMRHEPSAGAGMTLKERERKVADERLCALDRMEKNWGSDWVRAAGLLASSEKPLKTDGMVAGPLEVTARSIHVGERAKDRERRAWIDAMRDGILLCILINHLCTRNPPPVSRINLFEDGVTRSTNALRFLAACKEVGLQEADICSLSDLQEASEVGLGRVALTVIALARLAGPMAARVAKPLSRPSSGFNTPIASPPASPSALIHRISPSTVSSRSTTPVQQLAGIRSGARSPPPRITFRPRQSAASSRYSSETAESSFLHGTESDEFSIRPRPAISPSSTSARAYTPSLVSSASRSTSTATTFNLSGATTSDTTSPSLYTPLVEMAVDDEDAPDDSRFSLTRERRMSERTLQMARQKIFTTMLRSTEDLEQTTESIAETRSAAISRSLAALEGTSAPARPSRKNEGRRPSPRRAQSVEIGREEASLPNVVEDTAVSRPRMPISPLGDDKRGLVRRRSTNGKVYMPKRSASPSPTETSAIPFPFSTDTPSPRASLIRPVKPLLPAERPTRIARAVSEINVRNVTDTRETSSSPGKRRESLSPDSGPRLSSTRGSVSSNAVIGSSTRQILVFEGSGRPSVSYQLGNCIGRGQFGSVFRALNLSNGQMAAIKRIQLKGLKEDEVTDVMREVDLLQSLSHPSIVKYEGMSRDAEYLNIVMEYVENGSLGQTLKAFGKFNEQLAASYATKILEGLHYLHSQQVVHCDLKAANILSTKNGNVKLSDFGVSLNMKAVENIKNEAETFSRTGKPIPVKDVAGTPHWMAPEVIQLAGALPVSDIWSLGCTIIELLTGKPPYADISNSMTVLFRIVEDDMPPLPPGLSDDVSDFLQQCFFKDPKHRPSAAMLFEHRWLKGGWGKEIQVLRPQDSIPFLRRVSQDLQRVDSTRLFSGPGEERSPYDGLRRGASVRDLPSSVTTSATNLPTATSEATAMPRFALTPATHKSHRLLKTTFSKAIICRLCSQPAKRSCVICQDCGLICHASCANEYPSKCDQLAQLLAYAQQTGQYDFGELTLSRTIEVGPQSLPVTSELLSSSPVPFQQKFLHGFRKQKATGFTASARTSLEDSTSRPEAHRSRSSLGSGRRSLASRLSIASSDTGSAGRAQGTLAEAFGETIDTSGMISPMSTTSRLVIPAQRSGSHRRTESKDCVIM